MQGSGWESQVAPWKVPWQVQKKDWVPWSEHDALFLHGFGEQSFLSWLHAAPSHPALQVQVCLPAH